MITLTKIDEDKITINEDYIELIEASSENDSNVKIHLGTSFVVKETPDKIMAMILDWNRAKRKAE